jgi:hypothetical protein
MLRRNSMTTTTIPELEGGAEIWKLRTMPSRATSAGLARVMSCPLVEDLVAGGAQGLRDQVEAGRLAGTVRADQRMDRSARDLERDALDRIEAVEVDRQVLGLDNVVPAARNAGPTIAAARVGTPERGLSCGTLVA